jgi:hypothetical protein
LAAMRRAPSRVSFADLIKINAKVRRAIMAAYSSGRAVGRAVPAEPHTAVKVSNLPPLV